MADQIALLQEKANSSFVELAKYESEKANLEVALQVGMARRGSHARMTKLKGQIRGAKLRLSNAEKKLQDALALRVQSGTGEGSSQQAARLNVPGLSNPERMVDDADLLDQPNDAGDVGLQANDSDTLIQPNDTRNAGLQVDDADLLDQPNDADDPGLQTGEDVCMYPTQDVPGEQASGSGSQFKHLNLSESDNEDDSALDMNLITKDDKAQMQQTLFQRRFIMKEPPKKRPRYIDPSDSDGTGDSHIFDDDEDSEPINVAGIAQSIKANPGMTVHQTIQKLLPTTKGKEPKRDPKDGPGAGMGTSKREEHEKKLKDKKGNEVKRDVKRNEYKKTKGEKEIGVGSAKDERERGNGGNDTNVEGKEYHPSEHSVVKAARVVTTLLKQRERLADEEGHRKFAEEWLNATSSAERPKFPRGIDLIRFDPTYLPDVATANYRLALELMLNQTGNFLCIPHVKLDRKLVSHVDNLEGPIRIWGTPFPRNQNANLNSNIPRPPHHFHCGCHEKVALAGFVMWKTWKAKAMINDQLVVEGLHQYKPFQPREVLFILQFLKSKFGYTVEDMFTGSFDEEEELRKEAQVMKKVANFCARRHFELIGQKMTLDDDISVQEEALVPEWI